MAEPTGRQVRVRVEAVSVNPIDLKTARRRPDEELVLGFDGAGVVESIGPEVEYFATGDPVWFVGTNTGPGTNQQLYLVDERLAARRPTSLDAAQAASMPVTAVTAWECLFYRLALRPTDQGSLLVVGATGGVGAMVLQLAGALLPGVRVIATAAPERVDWVRELGADQVVDHHRDDLAEQVLHLAPDGVDWVFTAHSAGQVEIYAQVTRPFGQIVAIDDGPGDLSALKPRSLTWHWESMFTRALFDVNVAAQHDALEQIANLVDAGRVRPVVAESFGPISAVTVTRAHEVLAGNHVAGKIVISGWAGDAQ